MGKDEAELVARCLRGDHRAYMLLYERYSNAMYHTCLRIVGRTEDAEDILQEAFMDAFDNLKKLRDSEAFGGWLKRMVLNKAMDHLRRKRSPWLELEETGLPDMPDDLAWDENEFAGKLQAVETALKELPPAYLLTVNLHVFESMSFEEIADLCGAPSSTVRARYARARQQVIRIVNQQKELHEKRI